MTTIYKDRLIEITDEELIFHQYYFPFGGDKRVPLTAFAGNASRRSGV